MSDIEATVESTTDTASAKLDELRSQAAPMLDKASEQAKRLVQQGRESMHDGTRLVKDKAAQATELAVGYAKDEPVRAMIAAAAVGALLMALVTTMARSRD